MKLVQFTPNILESYAAALRNLIAGRIIKGENIPKNLRLLKIILVFSALFRNQIHENVKTYENIENLLLAAAVKYTQNEKNLNYSISGERNYKIDFYSLKLLILELVSAPTETQVNIKIILLKDRMIFTVQNAEPTRNLKKFVKKLKGNLIKIRGESIFAVMLLAPCVLDFKNLMEDNEDYEDTFSSVNIMLFR